MAKSIRIVCLLILQAILISVVAALPLDAVAKRHQARCTDDAIGTADATPQKRWPDLQNKPRLIPPDFVALPGRTFQMGRTTGSGDDDEVPVHYVSLSPFAICRHEVTQAEWQAVMGSNPAEDWGVGPNHPVYYVSWYAILKYCNLRSIAEGYTPVYTINGSVDPFYWGVVPAYDSPPWNGVICAWDADGYRLPTDAEWEFAARGGTNFPDYVFSGSNDINQVAWNDGNATIYGVKPVCTKAPNALGIHDMSGNLWEYCWDWLDDYTGEDEVDPTGPATGFLRIARGGYWLNLPQQCRVYERSGYYPFEGSYWMGFRVAKSLPDPR